MKDSRSSVLFLASSVLSLMIPTVIGFYAGKDEVNLPSLSIFLIAFVYVTAMYAVAGGFEWSAEAALPKWRFTLFVFLGGLGLSIWLGLIWFGIRILFAKVFNVPELANFRLLSTRNTR